MGAPFRDGEWQAVRVLIVMAGVPGSGKSSIATYAAKLLGCSVISVDPIEAAILRSGVERTQPTGLAAYVVAEAIAEDQLRLGHDVIIDAVNDAEPARQQWIELAQRIGEAPLFVEVHCSDVGVHRRRLETRRRDLPGFPEPEWETVADRQRLLREWSGPRLTLDSIQDVESNAERVLAEVRRRRDSV
jgi:predicted kinase